MDTDSKAMQAVRGAFAAMLRTAGLEPEALAAQVAAWRAWWTGLKKRKSKLTDSICIAMLSA